MRWVATIAPRFRLSKWPTSYRDGVDRYRLQWNKSVVLPRVGYFSASHGFASSSWKRSEEEASCYKRCGSVLNCWGPQARKYENYITNLAKTFKSCKLAFFESVGVRAFFRERCEGSKLAARETIELFLN